MAEGTRAWLVERTYSDDEQNLVILVYATTDGERYVRKERALTSFTGPARDTYAAIDVSEENVGTVVDPDERERYAAEAQRMAETHDRPIRSERGRSEVDRRAPRVVAKG